MIKFYIPFLRYSLDYWNHAAYFYFYENSDPAKIFFWTTMKVQRKSTGNFSSSA